MSKPILTAMVGSNNELFPSILALFVPDGSVVADVTWGNGVFWKDVDTTKYNLLKSDIRPEYGEIDFRQLPYADKSLDGLVLDPPYMHTPGSIKSSINGCYYNNNDDKTSLDGVIQIYRDGIDEAARVLKPKGIIIVKCQDQVACGKQRLVHIDLCQHLAQQFIPEDIFVMVSKTTPAMDPKWTRQYHARKNHSYFLVYRRNRK